MDLLLRDCDSPRIRSPCENKPANAQVADTFLKDLLNKAPDLYLVFLGGPYAAAILAKVGVTQNLQTGKLQKSDGSGVLNPADLISNDTGATDLYDFQYTIFNLIAILAVLTAFIPHPVRGLPQIPDFLAILTGGAALTYTLNKAVTTNPPSISSVDPDQARIQDFVTIYGTNLYDPNATGATTILKVGGVKVPSADLLERRLGRQNSPLRATCGAAS